MKLTVKTLKGKHFEIPVQPNDTIMAVKKNIEEILEKGSYPWGQQMLIFNGKLLKDESTLEANKVNEDGFLVVMLRRSMKLTVKTLKGTHFEIRVQHNDTIMAVKKNIEEILGKDRYPWGQQMLIFNGKVLKDESTLEENKVNEDGFLVVVPRPSATDRVK